MNLKSLTLIGLLSALSACSNQAQGVFVEKFFPLASVCDGVTNKDDVIAGNGYLDVAAGAPQFFVGVRIVGGDNAQQPELAVGGTMLEYANRNRPLVNQQVVTYRLSKRLGGATPPPFITNISLPFNSDGQIFGPIQLISAELANQLTDGLTPSSSIDADSSVDLFCDVEFKGEFSASRTPFSTGVLTFPIRVFRSNPAACANGYQRFPIDAMTGAVDACNYVGQRTSQLVVPPMPSCCPSMGAPGC